MPLVQRIIVTEVHESTEVSPAQLLYGNMIDLDRGILMLPLDQQNDKRKLSDYTIQLLEENNRLLHIAAQRQYDRDTKHLTSRLELPTEFPINSFVLVSYPDSKMGRKAPTKFHPTLKGPMRVQNFRGSQYELVNLVTHKVETHHVKSLRPFVYDADKVNLENIAQRDTGDFVVDRILKHVGNTKRVSDLDFLVRWQGQPESQDLWLPWRSLRNNTSLHSYLRNNGLHR